MFWGIIIGLAVGYLFHNQIGGVIKKTGKLIASKRKKKDYWDD